MRKIQELALESGYENVDEFLEREVFDSVVQAICMNPGCGYITEMEPDAPISKCENCETLSVRTSLDIMGLI